MNDQPPESRRGRRRLREPGPATPPPSRPAPPREDPRASGYHEAPQPDPRASGYYEAPQPDPRASGYHEAPPAPPPSRHSDPYDLPQPSRRGRPAEPGYDAPATGRRRRLEPPAPLPPAEDDFDPQDVERSAPARARHGLDAGADGPPPRRRRAAPEPGDAAEPRRRPAPLSDEGAPRRRPAPAGPAPRRRPTPEELAEADAARRHQAMLDLDEAAEAQAARLRGGAPEEEAQVHRLRAAEPPSRRRRAEPEPGDPQPGRRGPAPEPAGVEDSQPGRRRAVPESIGVEDSQSGRRRAVPESVGVEDSQPGRRRAAPEPADAPESRRRRAAPDPEADPRRGAPEPPRRSVQPGDRSVGVPEPGAEPPRRRRPPPPPVREDPPTDIIPAQAPAEPSHDEPEAGEFFAEDDEYADYDGYDDEYEDYDEDYEDEPPKPRKKKGKRALAWVAAIAVIALLAGGAYYGFTKFFGYEDFDGSGDRDVLFQVDDGDSTSAIGAKLASAGIVASGKAFVKAGADNPKLAKIQHGFYVMKSHMSGASAVDRITSPASRVGQLEVRPYTQFDDITQPDGKVTPGVYSLMAKASCAQLDGKSTCVSADDLRKAVDAADLKQLGVPDWAVEPANKADRKDRRLEGLIAPGLYDVRPGATAPEILGELVRSSTAAIQDAGLSPQSTGPGMTPYQTLIIASIIEREAVKADFGKLSRVIYNRLAINMRLQMDSTVNYVLDRPTLLTDEGERLKSGAYNTYKNTGLPPTPISVPSADAIQAAVHPVAGKWEYFVKCEKNGLSCFAVTNDEHNRNRDLARERGVI